MAHGGVRALVVAYARGDARCRADVMDALAALALTAKSLAELKTDSAALLLLLRFKAAAASSAQTASPYAWKASSPPAALALLRALLRALGSGLRRQLRLL